MLINGSMINSTSINGLPAPGLPPTVIIIGPDVELPTPDPSQNVVYEQAGRSYVWWLSLLVNGENLSNRLTGRVQVDREEEAAAVARFSLHMPSSLDPVNWTGKGVELDYVTEAGASRRFTGKVARPSWDPRSRILTCECSDQLQKKTEAMSVEQIDALAPAFWSSDVFDPVEGRSHWDYAMERLSTIPASLDCDVYGQPRITYWAAAGVPHFVFGENSFNDESLSVEIADLASLVNVVEVDYSYRYFRLWQDNQSYRWQHPEMQGLSDIQGWCLMMSAPSTEMPDRDMVESAVSGTGQTMLSSSTFSPMPATGSGIYCDPPFGWTNAYYPNLLMAFDVVAAQRWSQQVTEKFKLRLQAPTSVEQAGELISRSALGFAIETSEAQAWESTPFGLAAVKVDPDSISFGQEADPVSGDPATEDYAAGFADNGVDGYRDLGQAQRRDQAGVCLLQQGNVKILASHRNNTLSFSAVTPLCLNVDLVHTAELAVSGTRAKGKVRRVIDNFDMDTGLCETQISLAISRAGGTQTTAPSPLTLPTLNTAPPSANEGGSNLERFRNDLPTYLGGAVDSPPYEEGWIGVILNYADTVDGLESYPREIRLASNEIAAELRDEYVVEPEYGSAPAAVVYQIAVPNDILEL